MYLWNSIDQLGWLMLHYLAATVGLKNKLEKCQRILIVCANGVFQELLGNSNQTVFCYNTTFEKI